MTAQTLPTATAAQLANRAAAFAAIETAEAHLALGATSPRHLEAMADAILEADGAFAPEARVTADRVAKAEATNAQRTACKIDRFAQSADLPALRADLVLAGQDIATLVEIALAPPARRSQSRAERKEATRLANKTRVKVTTVATKDRKSKAAKAIAAQRTRVEAIESGAAVVLPTAGYPNVCPPPRGRATLWTLCRTWDDPNAALRFHTAG